MMGHFSHFRFPKQEKQPAFIKTKKQYDAFYVPAHYYFPERILQPLTKLKRAHKQDSSLWVISLIMPLYVGPLCFLSVRFKTNTRSVAFLENHTCWHRGTPRCPTILEIAAIVENYTCCLPELILQRRKSCSLRVILMQLSSMLGQIFLFFNVTP